MIDAATVGSVSSPEAICKFGLPFDLEAIGHADSLRIFDRVTGSTTYYVNGAADPERTTAALRWADNAEREFREHGGVAGTKH